jgi:hypothetical protein
MDIVHATLDYVSGLIKEQYNSVAKASFSEDVAVHYRRNLAAVLRNSGYELYSVEERDIAVYGSRGSHWWVYGLHVLVCKADHTTSHVFVVFTSRSITLYTVDPVRIQTAKASVGPGHTGQRIVDLFYKQLAADLTYDDVFRTEAVKTEL